MNGFGIGMTIKRVIWLLYTKMFWRNARLVRTPIHIRNKKKIYYGKGFTVGINCRINVGPRGDLQIGERFVMGDFNQIEVMESVKIGNNVLIASRVYIGDTNHGMYKGDIQSNPNESPVDRLEVTEPIIIGDNVWIGNGVSILPGVKISSGCIVGANSVVTKSFPQNCIIAGIPARIVRRYDEQSNKWLDM